MYFRQIVGTEDTMDKIDGVIGDDLGKSKSFTFYPIDDPHNQWVLTCVSTNTAKGVFDNATGVWNWSNTPPNSLNIDNRNNSPLTRAWT